MLEIAHRLKHTSAAEVVVQAHVPKNGVTCYCLSRAKRAIGGERKTVSASNPKTSEIASK
jgi:hypothetical protein